MTPAANIAAGNSALATAAPGIGPGAARYDFWLFDGAAVLFNYFSGDGAAAGTELRDEPAVVKLCASAFEAVWDRAVRTRTTGPPSQGTVLRAGSFRYSTAGA